jgi:hypothetical protein
VIGHRVRSYDRLTPHAVVADAIAAAEVVSCSRGCDGGHTVVIGHHGLYQRFLCETGTGGRGRVSDWRCRPRRPGDFSGDCYSK